MKLGQIILCLAGLMRLALNAVADKAVFAGGCCRLQFYRKHLKNPTYNGNHAGHYEAIEVTYEPNSISYEQLLDYY